MDLFEPGTLPTLGELVDEPTVNQVCRTFHDAFAMSVRIFDRKGNPVAEAIQDHPLCQYIRGFPQGRANCERVRRSLATKNAKQGESEAVECVCGLRYTAIFLTLQAEVVGTLVVGPYLAQGSAVQPKPRTFLG